ncbi:MAG: hypothetical protein C0432_04615 [Candidatus Puniceispirillum sp.]|nr:hypothetical protein [Candidatus Pelagibacter sp.]MBA4283559.1 hypothetical protein [Candidatus Puniceispirillum sp.]
MCKHNLSVKDSCDYSIYVGPHESHIMDFPSLDNHNLPLKVEQILNEIFDLSTGEGFITVSDKKSEFFIQAKLVLDDQGDKKFWIEYRPSAKEILFRKVKLCDLAEAVDVFATFLKYKEEAFVSEEWLDTGFL